MMPHVSAAVVLSMDTAQSRHDSLAADGNVLRNLCPLLYMQCNRGFKKCSKSGVNNTAHDLVHAYLNAFREMERHENVLIIEDDVRFDLPDLATHLKRVDALVDSKQGNYTAYTLGSLAFCMLPCEWYHRRIVGRWACTHAVIWSRNTREKLLKSIDLDSISPHTILHMDNADLVPELQRGVYTYYRPIATQIFPATENRGNWCLDCTNLDKPYRQRQEAIYRDLVGAFYGLLGLDKRTRPGWDIVYCGSFGVVPLLLVAIIIAVVVIVCVKVGQRNAQ